MTTKIQLRRGYAEQWLNADPTLYEGEIGIELDTRKMKVGDGSSTWTQLAYMNVVPDGNLAITDYVKISDIGAENGVAGLSNFNLVVPGNSIVIEGTTNDTFETTLTVTDPTADRTITFPDSSGTVALTSDISSAVSDILGGAPEVLDTLKELATAINDDPTFFTTVATNLSNHEADTTNVHGIANTANLATKSYADSAVSTHSSDTTSIHGINDTAELATKAFAAELLTNATKSNIIITGDKNGLTITAENGVADSTTDNLTEGTTNKYFTDERAQDAIGLNLGTGLTYTDSTGEIKVTPNTYDAFGAASSAQTAAQGYADDAISTHNSDTTNVHGIADTAALATKTYADNSAGSAQTAAELSAAGYTDNAISQEVIDRNSAISTAKGEAISSSNGYTDDAIAQEVIDRDNAISTALSTAEGYTNTAITNLVNAAPNTLDTLKELADAIGDDPNFAVTVAGQVSSAQTAANGYTDNAISQEVTDRNSAIATAKAQAISDSEAYADGLAVNYDSAGAADAAETAANLYTDGAISTEVTNRNDAIADAKSEAITSANLYTDGEITTALNTAQGYATTAESNANSYTDDAIGTEITNRNSAISTAIDALTTSDIEEGTNKYFSESRAQDAVGSAVGTGLKYDALTGAIDVSHGVTLQVRQTGPTSYGLDIDGIGIAGTGLTASGPSNTNLEIDRTHVDSWYEASGAVADHASDTVTHGVTGHIVGTTDAQSLSNKTISYIDNTITVQAANISDITATATELNTLDGITVSTTELNYVDGVTSSIQGQLDDKAPLASPTFTGNATMENLELSGALTFTGTASQIDITNYAVEDSLIYLADAQYSSDVLDIGFIGAYGVTGGTENDHNHVAFFRDATDGKWKLVSNAVVEPSDSTVDLTDVIYDTLKIGALEADSATIGNVSNTEIQYLDGVTSGIQGQIDLKAPINSPTFTGTVSGITKSMVGLGNVDNTSDANKPISSATQTALDLKAPIASPTFTGTVTIPNGAALGTPASVTLTNATGLPVSTGISGLATGAANFLASPTSANLATMLTDETGSGASVFGTSPTLKGNIYFQSGGGAGGLNNYLTTDNSTGAFTVHSGYPLNLTATGNVVITPTGGSAKVGSDTIATLTASQTLTGKTISGADNTLSNIGNSSLTNSKVTVGTTDISLGSSSTTLTGLTSVTSTAFVGNVTGNVSGNAGTVTNGVYTTDTATVTNTMLAGSIANNKLANSSISINGNSVSLGGSISGLATNSSPTFTGTVTLPLSTAGYVTTTSGGVISSVATIPNAGLTNSSISINGTNVSLGGSITGLATTTDVTNAINGLVNGAPSALDTLKELADAINDDASYAATITTALGTKAPTANPTFTGTVVLPSTTSIGNVSATEIGYVDGVTSSIQTQLDAKSTASKTETLTNKTISGSSNTISNLSASSVSSGTFDTARLGSGPSGPLTVLDGTGTWKSIFNSTGTIPNSSLENSSITVNGSAVSLGGSVTIDALPSQIDNAGKYLTTDGETASWANLVVPISVGTATLTSESQISVSGTPMLGLNAVEYMLTMKQASVLRTSKVILTYNPDAVDSVDIMEYAIIETGGTLSQVSGAMGSLPIVSYAINMNTNELELVLCVAQADIDNVFVKFSKVAL